MKKLILMLSIALMLAACKSDDAKIDDKTVPTNNATNGATNNAEPDEPVAPATSQSTGDSDDQMAAGTLFNVAIYEADRVTVLQKFNNGEPVSQAKPKDLDFAKFTAAMGMETQSIDGKPKCRPSHEFTFYKGEEKVVTFAGVCAADGPVVLTSEALNFHAQDPAAIHEMIK